MPRASPIQGSFNGGEWSPRAEGRVDVAKYGSSTRRLECFLPMVQGPAVKLGGFRYVAEVKDSSARTWLVRFEYNTQQAYVLEFGHLYVRVYANHGQVLSGGLPLEVATPYTSSDLTNSDGTFGLRMIESADVLYITHTSYAPRKLARTGPTTWVLTTLSPQGGPFKTENITATTVYASATTGAVTLTASAGIFQAGHVGSLFFLKVQDLSKIPPWEAYTEIVNGTGNNPLNLRRRSDSKNYICTTSYAITGAGLTAAVRTGTIKPVHTSGTSKDGTGNSVNNVAELVGVDWQFTDPGYGAVLITGYTSPTQVAGTVVAMSNSGIAALPSYVVGAGNPTTRWAFGAWSSVEGWPSHVAFFRERLVFGRAQRVWMSVAGDYECFDKYNDSGEVAADQAITVDLQSTQVNNMLWMETFSPSVEALMVGTAASEFVVKSQTENMVFGPENVTSAMVSTYGSRNLQPRRIGNVILYAQRAGTKLRDLNYDFYSNQDGSNDQSVLSEHLLLPGVQQIDYQQEPFSVLWTAMRDGSLAAMTYSREQYPEPPHGGWSRHPVAGGLGAVESVCCIPDPDQSRDEMWTIVKITVNGTTKRYVCYQEQEFMPGSDPQDCFYVDVGGTLDNTALSITGSSSCTLAPGAGATAKDTAGVTFTAGAAIFAPGDVGREIHRRYTYTGTDSDGLPVTLYATSKALITGYTSTTQVICTITAAFPDLATLAANAWRLTVTTISGLGHLEGQTVNILADGAVHPQRTVSGGSITLQTAASKVHVGLPKVARLQTLRLNAGGADGTSQGKFSRISQGAIRVKETLGLKVGNSFANMDEVYFRVASDLMDNPAPLYSGDVRFEFADDYDMEPWLCFESSDPLPCTIVAIMPQVTVSDRG